jgi:hypothetical protein
MAKTNKDKQCNIKHIEERPWIVLVGFGHGIV